MPDQDANKKRRESRFRTLLKKQQAAKRPPSPFREKVREKVLRMQRPSKFMPGPDVPIESTVERMKAVPWRPKGAPRGVYLGFIPQSSILTGPEPVEPRTTKTPPSPFRKGKKDAFVAALSPDDRMKALIATVIDYPELKDGKPVAKAFKGVTRYGLLYQLEEALKEKLGKDKAPAAFDRFSKYVNKVVKKMEQVGKAKGVRMEAGTGLSPRGTAEDIKDSAAAIVDWVRSTVQDTLSAVKKADKSEVGKILANTGLKMANDLKVIAPNLGPQLGGSESFGLRPEERVSSKALKTQKSLSVTSRSGKEMDRPIVDPSTDPELLQINPRTGQPYSEEAVQILSRPAPRTLDEPIVPGGMPISKLREGSGLRLLHGAMPAAGRPEAGLGAFVMGPKGPLDVDRPVPDYLNVKGAQPAGPTFAAGAIKRIPEPRRILPETFEVASKKDFKGWLAKVRELAGKGGRWAFVVPDSYARPTIGKVVERTNPKTGKPMKKTLRSSPLDLARRASKGELVFMPQSEATKSGLFPLDEKGKAVLGAYPVKDVQKAGLRAQLMREPIHRYRVTTQAREAKALEAAQAAERLAAEKAAAEAAAPQRFANAVTMADLERIRAQREKIRQVGVANLAEGQGIPEDVRVGMDPRQRIPQPPTPTAEEIAAQRVAQFNQQFQDTVVGMRAGEVQKQLDESLMPQARPIKTPNPSGPPGPTAAFQAWRNKPGRMEKAMKRLATIRGKGLGRFAGVLGAADLAAFLGFTAYDWMSGRDERISEIGEPKLSDRLMQNALILQQMKEQTKSTLSNPAFPYLMQAANYADQSTGPVPGDVVPPSMNMTLAQALAMSQGR